MQRFAVIDLGTNTFHLLIVERADQRIPFREIYREKRFVKLAEAGIETIGDAPFQRALKTLIDYRVILDNYGVTHFRAYGTAALRTASNGQEFTQLALAEADIPILLIDGATEAGLIQQGVQLTLPAVIEENYVIMDIGGGSVEFIISNQNDVLWAQSFPVGAAVLYKQFHHSDPISPAEIERLEEYLKKKLQPFLAILATYPTHHLIGASGTFDVLGDNLTDRQTSDLYTDIAIEKFAPFYQEVLFTTQQERYERSNIPDQRADMIVVALVLINFVLSNTNIQRLSVSNFAMKEGILSEMLSE